MKTSTVPPVIRTIVLASLIAVCVVAIAASLVLAVEIFLTLFLGVLFGVFLLRTSQRLSAWTSLAHPWSLAVVALILVILFSGAVALFGVQADRQVSRVKQHLGEGSEQVKRLALQYPSIQSLLESTPIFGEFLKQDSPGDSEDKESKPNNSSGSRPATGSSAIRKDDWSSAMQSASLVVGRVFRTTFGLLTHGLLIFFLGLFLAASPGEYRDGFVRLFPPHRRSRMRDVMNQMGDALWHWLIGQFASMLITGIGAGLLLAALGVPMALTLGILTGLLTFIPNLGAVISLVLAALVALSQGMSTVLLVTGGYVLLQLLESYVITPLIQQRQVSLPPALLISFQVVLSALLGFLGAMVAAPMLAAAKVAVTELYVRDVLEQPTEE